jgi:hypothetical protein
VAFAVLTQFIHRRGHVVRVQYTQRLERVFTVFTLWLVVNYDALGMWIQNRRREHLNVLRTYGPILEMSLTRPGSDSKPGRDE